MIKIKYFINKLLSSNILKLLVLAGIFYGCHELFKMNKITLFQAIIIGNFNTVTYLIIRNLNRRI